MFRTKERTAARRYEGVGEGGESVRGRQGVRGAKGERKGGERWEMRLKEDVGGASYVDGG